MKPWQLGDGDNTVATEQLRMEFIFDSINRQLAAIGVTDQTTFDAFANYIGYSTGGTPSYQDMQVAWTPAAATMNGRIGFAVPYGDDNTIETLSFNQTTLPWFELAYYHVLTSVAFPNLTSIDLTQNNGGGLLLHDCDLLASVSAPLLSVVGGNFLSITFNPVLTSISLPSLTSTPYGFAGRKSAQLSTVSVPLWLPDNATNITFDDCALSQASVDHILARCVANAGYVSGTVTLNGGTSSAPSSIAPGSDYAILVGRGVTVLVNP